MPNALSSADSRQLSVMAEAALARDASKAPIIPTALASRFSKYDADAVFDTNRMWFSKMRHLKTLSPNDKVNACVRSVSWIVDGVKQLVRRNTFQLSSIFNHQSSGTVA